MSENEGKRLLTRRLYLELQIFQYSVLSKTKKEIYESAYKIELMASIYELLVEVVESINETTTNHLLKWNGSILEFLYQTWLKQEDNTWEELEAHITSELERIAKQEVKNGRKEMKDGTEMHSAA